MSMSMGELSVTVDGKLLYSYKQSGQHLPSDAELLSFVTGAGDIPQRPQ
jgi:hypothetical protein